MLFRSPNQSQGFKGVPIPAAGLLIASFPLIYWYSNNMQIVNLLANKWFWYAVILGISYLMVSTFPSGVGMRYNISNNL